MNASIVLGGLLIAMNVQTHAIPSDFNQNLLFNSDYAHLNYKNNTLKATGHIKIQQGSILIEAHEASGILENGMPKQIILTGGPVRFQQQLKIGQDLTKGQAQRVEYVAGQDVIELSNNAKLQYNNMFLEAETIIYGMVLGDVEIKGTSEQQIRITIPPQQKLESKPLINMR